MSTDSDRADKWLTDSVHAAPHVGLDGQRDGRWTVRTDGGSRRERGARIAAAVRGSGWTLVRRSYSETPAVS